ncbi:AbrB/MazE/SpoVT family DNA-binding domain-containing protein [Saccharopolyspora pogona]|uniref:AbrB/MazE/SpoVT family DNA-binding domain-containing protein n=1 Tax=Saccharopolyspora pogona TaxID=333966 RepID=UPI001687645E|nr:AbrB/MazE/SpoVT family DNA-binding domain-containing protein [Saccharopolyspora pogona]
MRERIITGLVPPAITDRGSPTDAGRGEGHGLPLPVIARHRELPVTYGMARVDPSGRVSATPVLHTLEWQPAQLLTIRVTAGAIVLQPDQSGIHRLPSTPQIMIPATARACCGIRTGDSVLLVADPRRDMLLVDPLPAVDEALAQRHATVRGGEPA